MAGKRGPTRKPKAKKQDRRKSRTEVLTLVLDEVTAPSHPPPPAGISPPVEAAWERYWESPVAKAAQDVDLMALERLFRYYDQWLRFVAIVDRHPMVDGSVGQIRVNPAATHLARLETAISGLESELGLTPLARMRLGIAIGQAKLTAAELNRLAQEGSAGDKDKTPDKAEALLLEEGWEAAD